MITVWILKDGYWTGEIRLVDDVKENMTDVPLLKAFIKSFFDGTDWVEGATEEEIKAWEEANKPKPIEPSETDILLNELSEYVLSVEMQNIEIGTIASENSEYVLSLDERITNIEQGGQ